MIDINDLEKWLVDYITESIHNYKVEDNEEFNKWANSFEREEAEFVVNMEFMVDFGNEERQCIPTSEAQEYASFLIQKILDVWYLHSMV